MAHGRQGGGSEPERFRVLQYNLLLEELGSNFIPRTMRKPDAAELARAFGAEEGKKEEAASRWPALQAVLNSEYCKWHPLKTLVKNPQGAEARVRSLWDSADLLALGAEGWELQGLGVASATQLTPGDGSPPPGPRTMRGVLQEHLGEERGLELYRAISAVHESSCAWRVRGEAVIRRIRECDASLCAFEEYDMHALPTAGHPSFCVAMASMGYEGLSFRAPGQVAAGVGLFWRKAEFSLVGTAALPEDRVVHSDEDLGYCLNADLREHGFRDVDRRNLAMVRLVSTAGSHILFCGVHLMTSSRDKDCLVRAFELHRVRELISGWARPDDAVVLCGDFNINMRGGLEEHIWRGTPQESTAEDVSVLTIPETPMSPMGNLLRSLEEAGAGFDTGYDVDAPTAVARLRWQRQCGGELVLRDAFSAANRSEESVSSVTGTRSEMIDYIFHDEGRLSVVPGSLSALKCPEEPMPNSQEPSDHVPLTAEFELRPAADAQ